MKIPLLTFLARYVDDPKGFRRTFDLGDAATRARMMSDCGIASDDEVISAILREDEHAVGGILANELARYGALRRNDGGDSGEALPLWPGVPIHIDKVVPAEVALGGEVRLEVHGWYFEGDPSALDVGFGLDGAQIVRATVERCVSEGAFGRTVATVKVTLPAVGDWTVVVSNTAGSRIGSSKLPNAVKVA